MNRLKHSTSSAAKRADWPDASTFTACAEDYKLVRLCGRGSTSQVWLAEHEGRQIAIKIVDLEHLENVTVAIQEVLIMRTVQHPSILPLLTCFLAGSPDNESSSTRSSFLWLVLPFIAGGSALSLLQHAFPQGVDEAAIATLMKPCLDGLAYLHGSTPPVLHRDVKAGNLLIDAAKGHVFLADLGVAAAQQRCFAANDCRYLQRFSFVGSPAWMAPEIMEQSSCIGHDAEADIYSFGITLIELACGRPPYSHLPFAVAAVSKLQPEQPTLDSMDTGKRFSSELHDLVRHCVARNPQERATAAHLLHHSFFRKAGKHPQQVLQGLMAEVPPLTQRLDCTHSSSQPSNGSHQPAMIHGLQQRHRLESLRTRDAKSALERMSPEIAGSVLGLILRVPARDRDRHSPTHHHRHHHHLPVPRLLRHSVASLVSQAQAQSHDTSRGVARVSADRPRAWLPLRAVRASQAILIGSASIGGFGIQALFGTGIVLARVHGSYGTVWSAPAYFYATTATTAIGLGDYKRERVMLFPHRAVVEKLKDMEVITPADLDMKIVHELGWSEDSIMGSVWEAQRHALPIALMFSVEEGAHLGLSAAPRGALHPDHDSNERLYGRPVTPMEILSGNIQPPPQFEQLIKELRELDAAADQLDAIGGRLHDNSGVESCGVQTAQQACEER